MTEDEAMAAALELAGRGRYSVSPNPMVGCVALRDGAIIGQGWHRRAGDAHAEVEALQSCADPRGATLVITLEPCAHHGRTPPCTEAIISAGIRRVVAAMTDPNEEVDGRGFERLRAAGIEVSVGVREAAARRLNERFIWNVTQHAPFVLLKAALTLDGKLATVTRDSQWITSTEAREKSLALREEYDAVLVGSGTVRDDNPRLTRRLGWNQSITPWTRVVLDSAGEISPHAQLMMDGGPVILFTQREETWPSHVVVIPAPERLDFTQVFQELYARGIRSLIVEGGSLVHSDLIRSRLWQKMILFMAPMIVGGETAPAIFAGEPVQRLTDAHRFRFDRADFVGKDLMITAYPV